MSDIFTGLTWTQVTHKNICMLRRLIIDSLYNMDNEWTYRLDGSQVTTHHICCSVSQFVTQYVSTHNLDHCNRIAESCVAGLINVGDMTKRIHQWVHSTLHEKWVFGNTSYLKRILEVYIIPSAPEVRVVGSHAKCSITTEPLASYFNVHHLLNKRSPLILKSHTCMVYDRIGLC